ncbi:S1 RNA-binding domain-containing protein [Streptomyces sp. 067-1]|uniref:S1 RNA-binding domain-containing protein n=1 Tax=Streptomyces sp. 067-1 TaxID=2789269 RepID=UPI0039F4DD13
MGTAVALGHREPGTASASPFGVFVQVAEGVEGLVRLPELSSDPTKPPEDVVRVGEEITVVVTDIDRERHRLSLSLRAAT